MVRSCATWSRETGQGRKAAAISGVPGVPQECRAGANCRERADLVVVQDEPHGPQPLRSGWPLWGRSVLVDWWVRPTAAPLGLPLRGRRFSRRRNLRPERGHPDSRGKQLADASSLFVACFFGRIPSRRGRRALVYLLRGRGDD